jgi:DNA-binding beta-propeller fold protein YncE
LLQGGSRIIKLNFELNQSSIVVNNDNLIRGVYFELSNNNLYVTSESHKSIYIYQTYDEITFNKIANISTSYLIFSITINYDNIYIGTSNGTILVYNKTSNALMKLMANMCSSFIRSIKFDCNANMIYSCTHPPMVKIIGADGINSTLLLNDFFTESLETYVDSKSRLWIGGKNGFIVYN